MAKNRKTCNRGRVSKMWSKDPNCHWCKRPTVKVESRQQRLHPHSATFDHLYHKSDPQRHTKKGKNLGVLACYECNQKRGRDAHIASLPAWNRFLIKYNVPVPIWKIRKKIGQLKIRFKRITKTLNWFKRHLKYKFKKGDTNVTQVSKRHKRRIWMNFLMC